MSDKPTAFRIWSVTCPKDPDEIRYILDDGNDPDFECNNGCVNFNHLREGNREGHIFKILGWTTVEECLPKLKQGKPDWWSY